MSKRKTERLLGLVVCLLSTRRYLTADQIREAVPGYPEQDDLFKRMFERDKEDLRELGVPLETGLNHPFDDDAGYRIRRQAYELPELRLEPDEAAVLGLAARVWQRAELAGRGRGRAAQAARGRDRRRGRASRAAGHRAQARHARARLRAALGGGQGPPAGDVQLPGGRPQRAAAARAGAVGRGEPARPLVRGRPGPGAERHPGVPAEPDRGAGEVLRPGRAA